MSSISGWERTQERRLIDRVGDNPARIVMGGFAIVIFIGTFLLTLPIASQTREGTPVITALFTATSATCVTGLVTVDTATHWSTFGELVVLGLIQIGGFGVMSLASMLAMLIGRKVGTQASFLAAAESRTISHRSVGEVLLGIVKVTFLIEAVVMVALTLRFWLGYGDPFGSALYAGFFHSVSAFNNAGFGLQPDSVVPWVADPYINLPLMAAVMLGGIGFPVLWELRDYWRRLGKWSIHLIITLGMSVFLWVSGTIAIAAFEWTNPKTLGALDQGARVLAAAFQSVVARTAGFNSVSIGDLHQETLLTLDGLMFIGGGSAGTAGGIKVTTFALLGFVIWAELRGEPTVRVLHRRLPAETQRQALTIALLSVGGVATATAGLLFTSDHPLDDVLFEAISAFATVGMSTGITPTLSEVDQLILIFLMFLGRLGPITLGAALALRTRPRRYDLPQERMLVG